jgi:UDP-glucose 4-epimerase
MDMTIDVPRKILVTGGAGFIGAHLTRALLARGHRVLVYDNLSVGRASKLPEHPCLELVARGLNEAALLEACRTFRPEIVFHLGALHYIPYCLAHPDETWRVNVLGTRALLEACRAYPVGKLIFISSAAVYPDSECALDETVPPAPVEIYGQSKWAGEQDVADFFAATRTPSASVRLLNVYGDGETNPHVIPRILEQLKRGDILELGSLSPKRDYVFVDDVVRALLGLGFSNEPGLLCVNVGTGREHAVSEILDLAAEILQRTLTVRQSPALVRAQERQHLFADVSRIAGLIGWHAQVDLRQGLGLVLAREGLIADDASAAARGK